MGFFSSIGNALKKVGGAVVKTVGKVADGVLKNVPIVKNVYGVVTNVAGGGISNLTDKLADTMTKSKADASPPSQAVMAAHEALQVDGSKSAYGESYGDVKDGFAPVAMHNGTYVTANNAESSFDSNALTLPVTIESGKADQIIDAALAAAGISPAKFEAAVSASPTVQNALATSVGTASAKTAITDVPTSESWLKKNWWVLAAAACGAALLAFSGNKKR